MQNNIQQQKLKEITKHIHEQITDNSVFDEKVETDMGKIIGMDK